MKKLTSAIVSCCLLLVAAPVLVSADEQDPAGWAPADALIYVGVTDVQKTWDDFKKTATYQMLTESKGGSTAGSAQLLNKWATRFKSKLAKVLEVDESQLKNPFGGGVAIYITVPRGGGHDDVLPGLIAGVSDGDTMQKYYQKIVGKLREGGSRYESVSAGANTIDVFAGKDEPQESESDAEEDDFSDFEDSGSSDADPVTQMIDEGIDKFFSGEAMPEKLAMCLTPDRLIVADTPDTVKSILRRESGEETMAKSDLYRKLERTFDSSGAVRAVVNLPRIFEMAEAEDPEESRNWKAVLGAQCLEGVIAQIRINGEGFDYITEGVVLMSGDRTGIAKILSMKNREIAPPRSVPSDSTIYGCVNVNLRELLDEILKITRQVEPEQAEQMNQQLEEMPLPDGQVISPRKDFIEHLREPITFTLRFTRPYDGSSPRPLLAISHRDREAMNKFFSTIAGLQPGMIVSRDLQGTQVFDAPMFGASLAPTNDAILLGTTAAVEAAVQSGSEPEGLVRADAFRKAAKLAAAEAWGVFYFDSRRFMESAIGFAENRDSLSAGPVPNAGAGIAMGMAESVKNEFGPEGLDKARSMLKHYAPVMGTLSTEPDGIHYIEVHLRPENN